MAAGVCVLAHVAIVAKWTAAGLKNVPVCAKSHIPDAGLGAYSAFLAGA